LKEVKNMSEDKDAYVKKLKATMDEWNAQIDKLAAKTNQMEAKAKIQYQKQIEDLRRELDDVDNRITELKQSSEGVWQDLKQGVENSWGILKASFAKAKSEYIRGYKEAGRRNKKSV
jgi:prefoldin subunit 5